MTSAAEGGAGFKMLTVADKGGGGLSLADVSEICQNLALPNKINTFSF